MGLADWEFRTAIPAVDESRHSGEKPAAYVQRISATKANAAVSSVAHERFIFAADTAVAEGDVVFGKPADAAEATSVLKHLRGHKHHNYTGLALFRISDGNLFQDLCVSEVPMRNYTDPEISAYVATGDPLDKAGSYAIQNETFQPVQGFHGCFASVMGLPLCHLARMLVRAGEPAPSELPAKCQAYLKYKCPVSAAILRGEQVG